MSENLFPGTLYNFPNQYSDDTFLNTCRAEFLELKKSRYPHYGISDIDSTSINIYTFDTYLTEMISLATNINETYKMTLDQVTNWDLNLNWPDHLNSGIKNAVNVIDLNYYILTNEEITDNNLQKI